MLKYFIGVFFKLHNSPTNFKHDQPYTKREIRKVVELELIRVDKYSEQTFTHLLKASHYQKQVGSFELCSATNIAYLFYADGKLVGFTVIGISNRREFEVCALYITPTERRKRYATEFMAHIWSVYKGRWKVRMQDKIESSCGFWRKTLADMTNQSLGRESEFEHAFAV
ncbi:N-acetyltransferase [Pseudoalteromonas sp. A22]|nr:N-acetyltransferase [Pseudoalteromonas sp. A22]USE68577.1 N-acetyltransferase [Pseudoalteromonas flavipulchra]